ncbi:unnamed protein product [Pedinophyceae sp. YPF-701]|nr:unnamed protein product [Pedinophyceae sp. YPF-701]
MSGSVEQVAQTAMATTTAAEPTFKVKIPKHLTLKEIDLSTFSQNTMKGTPHTFYKKLSELRAFTAQYDKIVSYNLRTVEGAVDGEKLRTEALYSLTTTDHDGNTLLENFVDKI